MFYKKRLISQKYKKCSPGKYAMLLYLAVSLRWISIRFDSNLGNASVIRALQPDMMHMFINTIMFWHFV